MDSKTLIKYILIMNLIILIIGVILSKFMYMVLVVVCVDIIIVMSYVGVASYISFKDNKISNKRG